MLMLPGQSRQHVPNLTPEAYMLFTRDDKENSRFLLTRNDGQFQASTRAGRNGLFEKEEEAHLGKLIEKAGLETADRARFFEEAPSASNESEGDKG